MTSAFDTALAHTLGIEGGYADNPYDSGGITNFGITEAVARAFGYKGPMTALPLKVAVDIYRQNYWDLLQLDKVAMVSVDVAVKLFDVAVNCSPGFAARSFQRCLNALNRRQKYYPNMPVDGLVGAVTISALRTFLSSRGKGGQVVLLRMINSLQGARYILLGEKNEKDEEFTYGWFSNRITM